MAQTQKMRAARKAYARIRTRTAASAAPVPMSEPVKDRRVWSHDEFALEFEKAKRTGPRALSNTELLQICRGAHSYLAHYWIDRDRFFAELWRRIEQHRITDIRTKAEACNLIGLSPRWARMIVSGKAKDSNKHKASKARTEESSGAPKQQSDQDYVNDIARYANQRLQSVMVRDWPRFQEICTLLEKHFAEAAIRSET